MIAVDPSVDCAQAINAALSTGQEVRLRNGVYPCSSTIGPFASGAQLVGEGLNTRLQFHGLETGIRVSADMNVNVTGRCAVRGVTIEALDSCPTAMLITGGGQHRFDDVDIRGDWEVGIALVGAQCNLFCNTMLGNPGVGIYFVEGDYRGLGWTVGGSTNCNTFAKVNYNGCAIPFRHEGGAGNTVRDVYANAGGAAIINGGTNLQIDNWWTEAPAAEMFRLEGTPDSRLVGTNLFFRRLRGGRADAPFIKLAPLSVVKGFSLYESVGQTTAGLVDNAGAYIVGPVISVGNCNWGDKIFTANQSQAVAFSASSAYYGPAPDAVLTDRLVP